MSGDSAKANDGLDDGPAIQKAIDSGASTVYLPHGKWCVKDPIVLRGKVRRFVGCRAFLDAVDRKQRAEPLIRISDGDAAVTVEGLIGPWTSTKVVASVTARAVVLSHCCNVSADFSGGGEVYLEDVVNNPGAEFTFTGVTAWARQFNAERDGVHIINDHSRLWILGLKTERGGTLIETRSGGETEVLGGLSYTTDGGAKAPMFTVTDGRLAFSIGEVCFSNQPFRVIVRESHGGKSTELSADDPRWGRAMVLFASGPDSP